MGKYLIFSIQYSVKRVALLLIIGYWILNIFFLLPSPSLAADCQSVQECATDLQANGRFTLNGCGRASGGNIICQPGGLGTVGAGGQSPFCGGNVSGGVNTAIGCLFADQPTMFVGQLLGWGVGIGGGIAFLLIVYAGFMIATAAGDPKRVQAARELLMSAIGGLILIVLSVLLLNFIGVKILNLSNLGFNL